MINNLYPIIQQLTKSDKIRLLQFLVKEIAEDENIGDKDEDIETYAEEDQFWLSASQTSLEQIWDHPDEDIYNELL